LSQFWETLLKNTLPAFQRLFSRANFELLFFAFFALLLFGISRFAFPLPGFLFYPGFYLQFFFGLLPQLYHRKWGRIFTAVGGITLVRISWLGDPLPSVQTSSLLGLFLGSIVGILIRELLLILMDRGSKVLPTQSDRFLEAWMIRNPLRSPKKDFFFHSAFFWLFFGLLLLVVQFIQGFGLRDHALLEFREYLYYPQVSSREYFASSALLALSVLPPVLYLFCEERFSTQNANLSQHLRFGIFLGFWIQLLVMFLQSQFSPEFLSAGSNRTLAVHRIPGLFLDSGSASWMLPVIACLLLHSFLRRISKTKEPFFLPLSVLLILAVFGLGLRLGKVFWIIYPISLLILFHPYLPWKRKSTKFLFYTLLPILLVALLWSAKFLPSDSSLQRIGDKIHHFVVHLGKGDFLTSLESWDQNRFELMRDSLQGFQKEPLWGNGWGSFLMLLKSPDYEGSPPLYDSPPNFYLGLLCELGILGSLYFALLVFLSVQEKRSYRYVLFLVVPLFFGTQIQHADGAFLAVLFLFGMGEKTPNLWETWQGKKWIPYTLLCLVLLFPLHFLLVAADRTLTQGLGANFRSETLGFYQTGAYEWAEGQGKVRFQGKFWEWKLASSKKSEWILVFASDEKEKFEDANPRPFRVQLLGKERESLGDAELVWNWSAKDKTWIGKGNRNPKAQYFLITSQKDRRFQVDARHFNANREWTGVP